VAIFFIYQTVQHYPFNTLRFLFSAISWRRIGWDVMLALFHITVFILILILPGKTPQTKLPDQSQQSGSEIAQPVEGNENKFVPIASHEDKKRKPPDLIAWIVSIILTIDGLGIFLLLLANLIITIMSSHRNIILNDLFIVRYLGVFEFGAFLLSTGYFVACLRYLSKWRKGQPSGFIGTVIVSALAIVANVYLTLNSSLISYWSSFDLIDEIRFHSIYFIPALANLVALCMIIREKVRVNNLKKMDPA
jgi:hypothetical protein